MMGHRTRLIDGDEWDCFYARQYFSLRPGTAKKIKRQHNKRVRAQHKSLKTLLDELSQ